MTARTAALATGAALTAVSLLAAVAPAHAAPPRHGFNACSTIAVSLPSKAPFWLTRATAAAVLEWNAATGMRLQLTTDRTAAADTILVILTDPDAEVRLTGPVLGVTTPTGTADGTITGGRISLDGPGIDAWRAELGPIRGARLAVTLMRHELGHALGLPEAASGVMNPNLDLSARLTDGDVAAVHALSPPCRS